jgi:thymidine phosphorylase
VRVVAAPRDGVVDRLGAVAVGAAALRLGAGRGVKHDVVDHAVGVRCLKKRGDRVAQGEPVAEIHARTDAAADDAERRVLDAYRIGDGSARNGRVVLDTLA